MSKKKVKANEDGKQKSPRKLQSRPPSPIHSFTYDGVGNFLGEDDPIPGDSANLENGTKTFTYDSKNRQTQSTDPMS